MASYKSRESFILFVPSEVDPSTSKLRPTAVIFAIVFGSATAISFGLIGTSVIFLFLKNDHPQFARELQPLLLSSAAFVAIAGVSGSALYSTLKALQWRIYAQVGTALALIAVGFAYWPRP